MDDQVFITEARGVASQEPVKEKGKGAKCGVHASTEGLCFVLTPEPALWLPDNPLATVQSTQYRRTFHLLLSMLTVSLITL